MQSKTLWLSNEVFSWVVECEGGSVLDQVGLRRAYEIWSHANLILETHSEKLSRVDVISSLRRCINQRLKLIESTYLLKKIADKTTPTGYLEYLETFGVIRPLMLKRLFEVRNNIEHNDTEPPDIDRCEELLDLVWYFLKSTDEIVRIQRDSSRYREGGAAIHGFSIRIKYDFEHRLEFFGCFASKSISEAELPKHTKVIEMEMTRKDSGIFLSGCLDATNQIKRKVISDSMNAL